MSKIPKSRICLMFDKDAKDFVDFHTSLFPNSSIDSIGYAPDNYPGGSAEQILTISFTIYGISCLAVNGGPYFNHSEAFSFQIATEDQAETDKYWQAIVENEGHENACGWCKDKWGVCWQITPRTLSEALEAGGEEAKNAFTAMMEMKKIDVATINAARDKR